MTQVLFKRYGMFADGGPPNEPFGHESNDRLYAIFFMIILVISVLGWAFQ